MAGPSPKAGGCHGQGTDEKQQGKEETESRPQQEEKGCRSLAVRGDAKPGPVDLQSAGQEGPVRRSARNRGRVAQGLARVPAFMSFPLLAAALRSFVDLPSRSVCFIVRAGVSVSTTSMRA